MNIFEFIKWWWENNIEWIKVNDPWIIPFSLIGVISPYIAKATVILLPKITRAVVIIIKFWRKK